MTSPEFFTHKQLRIKGGPSKKTQLKTNILLQKANYKSTGGIIIIIISNENIDYIYI